MFRPPPLSITFSLCLLALLAGCNSGPGDVPPLGDVRGKVTLDGQLLANVRVLFEPTAGGRTSEALTEENGDFRLIYSSTSYGAKVGTHRVHFEHPLDVENSKDAKKVAIPPEFGGKSELSQEVKKGKNNVQFELVTPPSKGKQK